MEREQSRCLSLTQKTGMRISAAHILNEFDFLRYMLIWVIVRASGFVPEGVPGAIIAFLPAGNVLTIGFVFEGSLGNAKPLGILDE